jgi:hypothetical protein
VAGRFRPNKSIWAALGGKWHFLRNGLKKILWAENFGLKTVIAHTQARTIIAHFDNFLGYEYKNLVSSEV